MQDWKMEDQSSLCEFQMETVCAVSVCVLLVY